MRSPLADAVKQAVEYNIMKMHTCIPGTIESYDYATQKASVLPSIKMTFYDGTVLSHPVIQHVPVIFPRSGGASLTFPVEKGDGVLILFSERALERWLSSGGEVEPGVNRRFDLSDAIAIVGLNSISTPTLGTKDDVVLVYNKAKITIKKDGTILLQNEVSKIQADNLGKIELSNAAGKVDVDNLGNVELSNDKANIKLKADGKFDISNQSESLFSILDDTLAACANITVNSVPIDNKVTFQTLKSRLEQLA
jgi:hypothetical protein